ncbi:MAG: putative lipid II flippase FtsW [Bdellovibrionales bacterium]|nr:putative lipid II flippase FtsW [Bdellovibrionales bacterium]
MKSAATTSRSTWTRFEIFSLPVFDKGAACDRLLLFLAVGLAAFGLVMVYSASYILAQEKFGDGLWYFKKHIVFLLVGFSAMGFFRVFNHRLLEKAALPLFLLSLSLMLATLVPGVGHKAGGASRWLRMWGLTMQPVEIAKLTTLMMLAAEFSRKDLAFDDWRQGFVYRLWPMGVFAAVSLLQPDFGSVALVLAAGGMMFYLAGVRWRYLLGAAALALPALAAVMVMAPYRRARLLSFLNPWADPQGAGFQVIQSFLAFHRGGLFGVGLGNSRSKVFYLPEAHNDFILAVVGEELGFVGIALLCGAFLLLFFRGVRVAAKSASRFGALLASGVIMLLGMQAFWNAAIVLGLFPTKGMTLPLISSGGSSIVMALSAVGILLNISAQSAGDA